MRWNGENCLKCGACVGTCPQNAITLHEGIEVDESMCLLVMGGSCGRCIMVCPAGALSEVE